MKIKIAPSVKISDIQEEFNSEFPYLKLEFFNKELKPTGVKREHLPIDNHLTLSKCQTEEREGFIQFTDLTTVRELEKAFIEDFHIHAQVFRNSGSIWLETTMTDQWTLKKQNQHGKELSQKPGVQTPEDFDLLRDS